MCCPGDPCGACTGVCPAAATWTFAQRLPTPSKCALEARRYARERLLGASQGSRPLLLVCHCWKMHGWGARNHGSCKRPPSTLWCCPVLTPPKTHLPRLAAGHARRQQKGPSWISRTDPSGPKATMQPSRPIIERMSTAGRTSRCVVLPSNNGSAVQGLCNRPPMLG